MHFFPKRNPQRRCQSPWMCAWVEVLDQVENQSEQTCFITFRTYLQSASINMIIMLTTTYQILLLLAKQRSGMDKDGKWAVGTTLVEMVLESFRDKSKVDPVRLLKKYFNFADVFDKNKADRLPKHSQHNLAIEIEEKKQALLGLVYDKSLIKLGVFCDYVNVMLVKKFIWPSKSPSRAPVLFVSKKNGRLHLCVDFWSINAITKKKASTPIGANFFWLVVGCMVVYQAQYDQRISLLAHPKGWRVENGILLLIRVFWVSSCSF